MVPDTIKVLSHIESQRNGNKIVRLNRSGYVSQSAHILGGKDAIYKFERALEILYMEGKLKELTRQTIVYES